MTTSLPRFQTLRSDRGRCRSKMPFPPTRTFSGSFLSQNLEHVVTGNVVRRKPQLGPP